MDNVSGGFWRCIPYDRIEICDTSTLLREPRSLPKTFAWRLSLPIDTSIKLRTMQDLCSDFRTILILPNHEVEKQGWPIN
jgi:hypothetical protein